MILSERMVEKTGKYFIINILKRLKDSISIIKSYKGRMQQDLTKHYDFYPN
jgi:hypothetical protein